MMRVLFFFLRTMTRFVRGQYTRAVILFLALVLYSATGYLYFELSGNPELTWGDAFWWSVVTMTTVGYGDFFPSTTLGRMLVGVPTMLMGIGILGYILSVTATAMLNAKLRKIQGMNDIHLTGHIVICHFSGLDNILNVIRELKRDSSTEYCELVVVDDAIDQLPLELQKDDVHFVKGDPARDAVLEKANVKESRAVIILSDLDDRANSDNKNLRVAITLDEFYPDVYTVVECLNPDSEVYFQRANVDSVVCIASLTGQMVVQEVQDPGVGSILNELTSNRHEKQLYVMKIKESVSTYGSLQEQYQNKGILPLGVRRGQRNYIAPNSDFPMESGDRVLVISSERPRG